MIIDITTRVSNEKKEKWLSETTQPFVLSGHIGTHLDTYEKTEIPMNYFRSKGVYIDVRDIAEKREIEIEDIEKYIIPKEAFVIFHTGRTDNYEYGSSEYFKNHPQLSDKLIEYLAKQKIHFIGIDCSGIRRGKEHEPADILCEHNGIYVIENLCNLSSIISSEFDVYTMWLENDKMTGLPCRVIVEIKH